MRVHVCACLWCVVCRPSGSKPRMSWPGAGSDKTTHALHTLPTRSLRPPHSKPRVSWSEELVLSLDDVTPSAAAVSKSSAAERYWARQKQWDRMGAGGSRSAGSRTPRALDEVATESVTGSRAIAINAKPAQGQQGLRGSSPASSSPPPLSPENSGACVEPPPGRGWLLAVRLLAVQAQCS